MNQGCVLIPEVMNLTGSFGFDNTELRRSGDARAGAGAEGLAVGALRGITG